MSLAIFIHNNNKNPSFLIKNHLTHLTSPLVNNLHNDRNLHLLPICPCQLLLLTLLTLTCATPYAMKQLKYRNLYLFQLLQSPKRYSVVYCEHQLPISLNHRFQLLPLSFKIILATHIVFDNYYGSL